jgi:uncharacterized membrane protein YfcA
LDFSLWVADDRRVTWLLVALVGAGVGATFGVFGAGGSAFATPLLALIGVPAPIAVASPLVATLPSSLIGAREYHRVGLLDRRLAVLAVVAGVPAVLAGAALSGLVDGSILLLLSGFLLLAVGARMLWPTPSPPPLPVLASTDRLEPYLLAPKRRRGEGLVVGLVAAAAFVAGLLANGGGLLLVPIFVLALGLSAARAAGTSMVAVAALTVPTLAAHATLGHVDWVVAGAFALGMIPASLVGARLGRRLPDAVARRAFGAVLVAFSVCFLALRVVG